MLPWHFCYLDYKPLGLELSGDKCNFYKMVEGVENLAQLSNKVNWINLKGGFWLHLNRIGEINDVQLYLLKHNKKKVLCGMGPSTLSFLRTSRGENFPILDDVSFWHYVGWTIPTLMRLWGCDGAPASCANFGSTDSEAALLLLFACFLQTFDVLKLRKSIRISKT